MGLLDRFKETRALRYHKGDWAHPATVDNSPHGTPSRGAPPQRKELELALTLPPPPPPPAPCDRPRRKSSSCWLRRPIWCFFSVLIILIILIGLTVLIIYLVFQPKLPKYTLLDVTVRLLTVTNRAGGPNSSLADLQNPGLNADMAFDILVKNPNKKLGIHYKDVSVLVFYQGTEFAHGFVVPFYQGRNSSTQVVIDLKATGAPLSESLGKELQTAISQNDIPLLARINVGSALEIGSLVLPANHVQLECDLRVTDPKAPHGGKLLSKSC